ncbi:MAG: hypothetical protein ACD_15C00212G0022 [uncultured bacterium]|nr:MAG: hypothetical protein ACD_15C00212G0022 [uncultured bacterium]
MVEKALRLSEPTILAILQEEGLTWGPKWVVVYIQWPGCLSRHIAQFGSKEGWQPLDWGALDKYFNIAGRKLEVVMREKCPTSVIVATKPWVLQKDEFLYSGGDYCEGIGVVASGARGRTDEAISRVVTTNIKLLAYLESERRIREELYKI